VVQQFVAGLDPWVSTERLESYRLPGDSDLQMVVNYLYNLALSEALYTPLSFLEISLRNSLHANLMAFFGTSTWYDLPNALEPSEQLNVRRVQGRLANLGKLVTPGRVVSELSFGFWVSLLSGPYDATIWRPHKAIVLKSSFPNIPRPLRQRKTIYDRYNALRPPQSRHAPRINLETTDASHRLPNHL
jgi:hypothetical protein